jgi:hypothetical protein
MGRWWKWAGAPAVMGTVVGVVGTLVTDRSWGWDLAVRCLMFSVMYALLWPLLARSRRRALERDAQHMRDIEEARRGRRG